MKPNFSLKYDNKEFVSDKTLIFDDRLEITLKFVEYKEYDATEWVLYFENKSDKDSKIISDIYDCDTLLPLKMSEGQRPGYKPEKEDVCIITMNGMVNGNLYAENDKASATEYNFNYEFLDKTREKTKKFENKGGRSSDGIMPFFDITAQNAGYIAAIGWTGDWKAEFKKCEGGVHIKTGLKETCFYLKPGEKIRTSSMLIMKYNADEDKHNKLRKLIKNHFSHKALTNAERESLMAVEMWGGLPSDKMLKRINELKKYGISFEDVWIDAGWYGNCTKCDDAFSGDWSRCTGEWNINTRVHENELKDVMAAAKDAGMNLMLWFEPERAINGTKVVSEHPEWFLGNLEKRDRILNYGIKEAFDYAYETISHYAKELELSCYRQDFNVSLDTFFKEADEENRRGITEIKHITGMYDLWDKLLAEFPNILIDNCSSGGRRIDIETLKRSIPFFRSDYQCNFNENPEVLQTHNVNISCYLPYNGCTTKTKGDTYAARSSYSSSWGGAFYNAIFQNMNEDDFAWAKERTDEYRRIRKYMSHNFYNHGSQVFDDTSWAIWQYHNEETQSGIIMAFRRSNSPFDTVKLNPKGFLKDKKYTFFNLDNNTSRTVTDSIEITLPEKRMSVIYEYTVD